MILFVNGDSHTAGAEAVNPYAFAEDDPDLGYLGRAPHPANLAVSWGRQLSQTLKAGFHCAAESASSNTRILRTSRDWLGKQRGRDDILVIIQWSTWERREWLIDNVYYQVNASGIDVVPESHQRAYKEYIASINWYNVCIDAHQMVWNFHQSLNLMGVKHIFFNGNHSFQGIQSQKDWGTSYIKPYDATGTYNEWLRNNGFETVSKNSWHFGEDAHSAWAKYMLQYIIDNHIL